MLYDGSLRILRYDSVEGGHDNVFDVPKFSMVAYVKQLRVNQL